MIITSTAKRYARALFDLAKEQNQIDQTLADFKKFISLIEDNQDLKSVLNLPNARVRERILEPFLTEQFSGLFIKFLVLLLKNNRKNLIFQVYNEYQLRHDKYNNLLRAEVTSALELPEKATRELTRQLEKMLNASVRIENNVDEKIIGGIIIRVDGKVYNASVLNKFKNLKTYLTKD